MPTLARLQRLLIGLILISSLACTRSVEPSVPAMPVSLSIPLYSAQYQTLLSPGGIALFTHRYSDADALGYGGLALVRSLTETRFFAYDLACPYERKAGVRLQIDDLALLCPSCGSSFEVVYGSGIPTSGPARHPLRHYRTHYDQHTQILRITN